MSIKGKPFLKQIHCVFSGVFYSYSQRNLVAIHFAYQLTSNHF